jgi:hypothetical protein
MDEHGRCAAIYSSGDPNEHMAGVCKILLELLDELVDSIGWAPARGDFTDFHEKVLQDLWALRSMSDFGVELNPVQKPVAALHRRVSDGRGPGKTDKIFWQGEDTIAVAHPDLFCGIEALKERVCLKDLQGAGAILPLLAAEHLAAQIMGHQLHPIADAQDRDLQLIDASI